MSVPILATRLYIPPTRPDLVSRARLVQQLNDGLHRKLTLISAPAGFGKTSLVCEWVAVCEHPVSWISLTHDEGDPVRFLTYLIAALQTIEKAFGDRLLRLLQGPQPNPQGPVLTSLLNDIAAVSFDFVLVLDDYHLVDSQPVDQILTFLLENLPPQMHLVITTRVDPNLPVARLRAKNQLTELRASDLRFDSTEAASFLNQTMGLNLSEEDITVLGNRTEGWITGLQLAAISMQGGKDRANFIKSFAGSHRYVLDYLIEEVLDQQSEIIREFLFQTAILNHLNVSLCNALTGQKNSQENLNYLEQANLFLIPLDNERHWYRYHHLFAEFLRERLQEKGRDRVAEYHIRASEWYAENGFELEAFQHAVAAQDIERAERLVEGEGIPMHFRGAGADVLNWLASLSTTELNARPSLWVLYASTLLFVGQHTEVEVKLQAAEAALQDLVADDATRDLVGRIASLRATLAIIRNDTETIVTESLRAQELLHPDNLSYRVSTSFTLGTAYQIQGDRTAAGRAFAETISIGGDSIYAIAAAINLGRLQEANNQLALATKTYERSLHLAGDPPQPITCEGFLGLARIHYEWNDFDNAEKYGQQCLQMTQQMENVDSFAAYGVFLSRMMLAQGDVRSAVTVLDEAEDYVHQNDFEFRMPDVAAAQVLTLLREGDLERASRLAASHDLPLSQARVHLARGDSSSALTLLERSHRQSEGSPDEQLRILVLQAVAYQAHGELDKALLALEKAMRLAEPHGFIRIFVDEGPMMEQLLSEARSRGTTPDYTDKLLAIFEAEKHHHDPSPVPDLVDPLSRRELEVLALLATGLKNQEIADQLFISLNTVLYHNKNIYSKLGVGKRTLAIIRARELNLLEGVS